MRDVIRSAARGAPPRESTQHEHERGVEERHHQDQNGQNSGADESDPRVEHRHQRDTPEEGADKQAAAIAHEQPRARTIPIQKPGQRPGQRDEQDEQPTPIEGPSNAARKAVAMSATPAARPSMLSRRLKEWHRPANQRVPISV